MSRFYGPNAGIDEDPVTGSAHCCLAPLWASKLNVAEGQEMLGVQLSARQGIVRVRLAPGNRVLLRGALKTAWRGALE